MTPSLLNDTLTQTASAGAPSASGSGPGAAPEIPAKFRDPQTGALRSDLLLRSYLELERKLARMVEVPGAEADEGTRRAFRKALGVPESPEAYQPRLPGNGAITVDPDVNRRLHQAGFTPEQVQLVYDLAAEKLIPAIEDLASAFEAEQQMDALVGHFGGEEKWAEVAKSLAAWGRKALAPEVYEALSSTAEGVLAMHKMMTSGEPSLLRSAEQAAAPNEEELKKKMADPRYWRDRDPTVVREVTEGFKRLFPQ